LKRIVVTSLEKRKEFWAIELCIKSNLYKPKWKKQTCTNEIIDNFYMANLKIAVYKRSIAEIVRSRAFLRGLDNLSSCLKYSNEHQHWWNFYGINMYAETFSQRPRKRPGIRLQGYFKRGLLSMNIRVIKELVSCYTYGNKVSFECMATHCTWISWKSILSSGSFWKTASKY
jgi:hypothetical protein